MHTNVLYEFIQVSQFLELLVQWKEVAMATAPEKVHWITHYNKLSLFTCYKPTLENTISSFLLPTQQASPIIWMLVHMCVKTMPALSSVLQL